MPIVQAAFNTRNKDSWKVTLIEKGMVLQIHTDENGDLIEKTEKEILLADGVFIGDTYLHF
jgi:hypothetical protein